MDGVSIYRWSTRKLALRQSSRSEDRKKKKEKVQPNGHQTTTAGGEEARGTANTRDTKEREGKNEKKKMEHAGLACREEKKLGFYVLRAPTTTTKKRNLYNPRRRGHDVGIVNVLSAGFDASSYIFFPAGIKGKKKKKKKKNAFTFFPSFVLFTKSLFVCICFYSNMLNEDDLDLALNTQNSRHRKSACTSVW